MGFHPWIMVRCADGREDIFFSDQFISCVLVFGLPLF
jgi:hypothetical protein